MSKHPTIKSSHRFRRSALALCVMASASYAQEEVVEEEVVVHGIRQSLESAQDLKRNAATVVDVVTAADINSLPDKSVVDALTRVPGVQVEVFAATDDPEHFGAEGSSALIRGLNRTLTEFNGRTSFSARRNAGLDLSNIPSELVGSIQVSKNQTADMIEGGIAGTLNLVTRKPFDADGLQVGGSIKANYGDLIDDVAPEISGLISNRWDTELGEFGFLFSGAVNKFTQESQGVGVHDFYEKSTRTYPDGSPIDGVGDPIPGREDETLWLPPSIQARFKEDERDRIGVASSIQWASPDENITATLEFIRSESTYEWSERLVQNKDSLGRQLQNANAATIIEVPGQSGVNESFDESTGLFTHGFLSGPGYEAQSRWHREDAFVNDWSLDLEFQLTDNLRLNTDFHYVDSEMRMRDHTIHNTFNSDVWVDVRDSDNPTVGWVGTNYSEQEDGSWAGDIGSITDGERVWLRSAMDHDTASQGDAFAFAADLDYSFDDSWISSIEGGVRFSEREQTHKETSYDWGVIAPEWDAAARRTVADYPQFQELVDFGSDFHGGNGLLPGSVTAFYLPKMGLAQQLNMFESQYRVTPVVGDETGEETFWCNCNDVFYTNEVRVVDGKAPGDPFAPSDIFEVSESRQAAYIQMNFEMDDLAMPIRGNLGFRYVHIDVESKGYMTFEAPSGGYLSLERYDENTVVTLPDDLANVVFNGAESDYLTGSSQVQAEAPDPYSDVLPSFNIVMNITDDVLVRFGASKAIYVPDLVYRRNSLRVSEVVQTVLNDPNDPESTFESVTFQDYRGTSVGNSNPFLEPEKSINLDLSTEWYFSEVGSLTFVLFNKELEDMIRSSTSRGDITNPFTGVTEEVILAGSQSNVGEATIRGYEMSYQQTYDFLPGFLSNLGLQANFTYLDTEERVGNDIDTTVFGTFTDLPLEGLSETSYNFIPFFETDQFSVRLAYNFRSEYMLDDRDVIADRPVYNADRGVWDFSFTYNITDNIKAGFDVNNLTDTQTRTQLQYTQAGDLSPRNYFVNDRRYSLRLSGSF